MSKPVAIILLNWNTPQQSYKCIASDLKYCDKRNFDIILADNGSTDDSLPFLKTKFPDLHFIENQKNLGFAEGNNRALDYSLNKGYTYSFLLNTDTEIDQEVIEPLLNYLDKNEEVGAVQPAIYWMHKPNKLWNGPCYFNPYLGRTYSNNNEINKDDLKIENTDWLTGCAMMIRNEALKESGFFTEKFFLYYEDVDLSFRIRQAGYNLHYLPTVKVYHEAGASGKQVTKSKEGTLSPIIHYYLSRNKLWIVRRYASMFLLPFIILAHFFYYGSLFIYFVVRRRWKKARLLLKGIKEGLFTPQKSIWI
jgi:GT2 family glycosyltransferase